MPAPESRPSRPAAGSQRPARTGASSHQLAPGERPTTVSAEGEVAPARRPSDELTGTKWLALLLDDLVTIPGTRIGVGLDSVIGLVPGVGDSAGVLLSGAVLASAVRQGVPFPVLMRMVLNVLFDALLGLVPVVGDALDVAHRANRKNLRLLQAVVDDPERTRRTSWAYTIAAGLVVALTLVALAAVAGFTLWLLWQLLTTKVG